ncbi:hypothetical protein VE23_23815 [Paenibacillus sp. D9]|uniref:hypothetical protein n=1 Tax=Paenibacillus TaxID=44249 RepID=UPI000417C41A|nr:MULTISPECIES: hypothetical protein [Paenibacillus]KKC49400.1 hypothetical protein VE23_23815 [Paenibacillus sp. D9]
MEFLKNAFLFLGGFLNVAILLTIAIVVILVLWARRRGDRRRGSYLSDHSEQAREAESRPQKQRDRARGE